MDAVEAEEKRLKAKLASCTEVITKMERRAEILAQRDEMLEGRFEGRLHASPSERRVWGRPWILDLGSWILDFGSSADSTKESKYDQYCENPESKIRSRSPHLLAEGANFLKKIA